MDRRVNNGGHSTKGKAGRPSKAEEVKMIETLTPLAPKAFKKLEEGVDSGDFKFIKLFFEYYAGKPKEHKTIDLQTEQPLFDL